MPGARGEMRDGKREVRDGTTTGWSIDRLPVSRMRRGAASVQRIARLTVMQRAYYGRERDIIKLLIRLLGPLHSACSVAHWHWLYPIGLAFVKSTAFSNFCLIVTP